MSKAAVTFAELFIVLALMFIIQTVVNFGLHEEVGSGRSDSGTFEEQHRESDSGLPMLETLLVKAEHVWYLRFVKPDEPGRVDEVTVTLTEHFDRIRSSVGGGEPCSSTDERPVERVVDAWGDIMLRLVNSNFAVTLQDLGARNAFLLTWSPAELPPGTELRVAVGKCHQESEAGARCPHPLTFRRGRADGTDWVQEACAHHSDLTNDRYPEGYTLFDGDNCASDGTRPLPGLQRFPGLEARVSLSSMNG